MGFSYKEAYNLPIWQRAWFIKRTIKEINGSNGANEDGDSMPATKAMHMNSPEHRAYAGYSRAQTPARLRRFS